jgi:hypothetical protein
MSISYNSKTFTFATTETFNNKLYKKDIPRETRTIFFGHCFNQEISVNLLPNTLNKITFGFGYNTEIKKGVLPKSITYLKLGYNYNHEICIGVLPKNLKHLSISNYKYVPSSAIYPSNLKILTISNNVSTILDNLPFIQCLIIYGLKNPINNLPSTLRKIIIYGTLTPEIYLPRLPFDCVIVKNKT